MILNILLTLLFVTANAFFVAAEFAIVKVRISQLKVRVKQGSLLAKYAENIVVHLDSYLSVTQLGITLSSLGLGWIGEPVVGKLILNFMELLNLDITADTAHSIAWPVAFLLISFLHIVFGELTPKSIAILYPENVTLSLSVPLKVLHFIFKPFIYILNGTANLSLRLIGLQPQSELEEIHSSEEIRQIIEESTRGGTIENTESELIENIFDFKNTPVKQIMVPRNQIEALPKSANINTIWEFIIERGYSRIPIYEKEIDNIVGVIFGKDLLTLIRHSKLIIMEDILRKPIFVNENDMIQAILKRMQKTHIQLAIVYNEFGGTAGLITIEDILEEIVGEIQDEHDDEENLVEPKLDGELEISASVSINDVNDFLNSPLPESEVYETLGGFILNNTGRIPKVGETITINNNNFTILEGSARKIEKVKIKEDKEKPETPN